MTDSFPGTDVNGAGLESDDTGSKAQEQTNVIVKLQCYFLPDFFIPPPARGIQKRKPIKAEQTEKSQHKHRQP